MKTKPDREPLVEWDIDIPESLLFQDQKDLRGTTLMESFTTSVDEVDRALGAYKTGKWPYLIEQTPTHHTVRVWVISLGLLQQINVEAELAERRRRAGRQSD